MTYKQIEASRELRLWIGQVIVPAVTMAVALTSIPEVRNAASTKITQIQEQGLNRPFAFSPHADDRKSCYIHNLKNSRVGFLRKQFKEALQWKS